MGEASFVRLGSLRDVDAFMAHVRGAGMELPCDRELVAGEASPLLHSLRRGDVSVGNRIAIHPMEGWDGTADGRPSEATVRRWRRFGESGAKLIWGGEAVAVRHDGRANPNQLLINESTVGELARLREVLIEAHQETSGSAEGLLIGLQLTHSGRYCVPNVKGKPEPRILYHHPILDRRVGLTADSPLMSDGDIRELISDFHAAARRAAKAGFQFVDVKHCHGYLGHEFLSAHTREGDYGGSFENRTRFLREIVEGIRAVAPGLKIGVRLSAFDMVPFWPDPSKSKPGKPGPGVPEPYESLLPYRWGFGVDPNCPTEPELSETGKFGELLRKLNIRLLNLTAGSPYYNPHIQRPAFYPPSDGYLPPEDPLIGVARQMGVAKQLKEKFPDLLIVGTGYSYLQEFLPNVAQAAIREGWTDAIGLGRVVLSYPRVLWDVAQGREFHKKRVCRTFSDCTTAPRNGLPSGCYPLDDFYKDSQDAGRLKAAKAKRREA